jgi:hypothetical protein
LGATDVNFDIIQGAGSGEGAGKMGTQDPPERIHGLPLELYEAFWRAKIGRRLVQSLRNWKVAGAALRMIRL